jgi:hypothetical protein
MEICHGAVMGMIKAESMRRAAMSSGSCRVHIIIYIYIYICNYPFWLKTQTRVCSSKLLKLLCSLT